MADGSRPVTDDLDLDVTGARKVQFGVQVGVPEGGPRLRLATGERGLEIFEAVHGARTTAASAGDGFEHDALPVAQRGKELPGVGRGHAGVRAGKDWHARCFSEFAGPNLVAEQRERLGTGPDER
jgi:hypothetical protein